MSAHKEQASELRKGDPESISKFEMWAAGHPQEAADLAGKIANVAKDVAAETVKNAGLHKTVGNGEWWGNVGEVLLTVGVKAPAHAVGELGTALGKISDWSASHEPQAELLLKMSTGKTEADRQSARQELAAWMKANPVEAKPLIDNLVEVAKFAANFYPPVLWANTGIAISKLATGDEIQTILNKRAGDTPEAKESQAAAKEAEAKIQEYMGSVMLMGYLGFAGKLLENGKVPGHGASGDTAPGAADTPAAVPKPVETGVVPKPVETAPAPTPTETPITPKTPGSPEGSTVPKSSESPTGPKSGEPATASHAPSAESHTAKAPQVEASDKPGPADVSTTPSDTGTAPKADATAPHAGDAPPKADGSHASDAEGKSGNEHGDEKGDHGSKHPETHTAKEKIKEGLEKAHKLGEVWEKTGNNVSGAAKLVPSSPSIADSADSTDGRTQDVEHKE